MAEQQAGPRPVIVEYFTPDARFGRQYGVASVHDALTVHPDARIMQYADGTPFEGKDAREEVKEARAEIREERAAEREQAKVDDTAPAEPPAPPSAEPAPVSVTDAPAPAVAPDKPDGKAKS